MVIVVLLTYYDHQWVYTYQSTRLRHGEDPHTARRSRYVDPDQAEIVER